VKNWRKLTFFWLHSILLTADGVGWLSIDITPQEVRTTITTTCNCTNSRPYTGDELEHIWMGFPSGSTVSSMFLCCFSRKIKCRFDCRKDDPDFWGWRACAWLNVNLSAWLCVSNNQSALNSARRPTNNAGSKRGMSMSFVDASRDEVPGPSASQVTEVLERRAVTLGGL
jgi:hypothetical protein